MMNPEITRVLVDMDVVSTKVFVTPFTDKRFSPDVVRQFADTGWKLPFPVCTVVFFSDSIQGIAAVIATVVGGVLVLSGRTYDRATGKAIVEFGTQIKPDLTTASGVNPTDVPREVVDTIVFCTCGALMEINGQGGVAYEATPNATNVKRVAKGKQPMFTWTTINLDAPRYKSEPKGGTHASPRLHDRRGHWVTSKLGKRFWRKDAKVGSAKNGITIQSYEKGVMAH